MQAISPLALGATLFLALLVLLVARVPIGIAMFAVGAAGTCVLSGWEVWLQHLKHLPYARLSNYDLAAIPLFLLMGQFATQGGLSTALFRFMHALVGRLRGGMAMASIGACAGFGAICGSSVATAATMGHAILPELRKLGYSPSLATGCLAAGGTLGILIPPSIPLLLYAILTEESVGKLFVAALLPGALAVLGYVLVIHLLVRLRPGCAPSVEMTEQVPWRSALPGVVPVLLVFAVVIVGIYGGWANPTEAAAIGALACAALALRAGRMRWKELVHSLLGMAQATAMIFLVLLGADMLNTALALSQLPAVLADLVREASPNPMTVVVGILLVYLLLGCLMDSIAMVVLTVPIFAPIVLGLDIPGIDRADLGLWFGILTLTVVEIGLIHPPMGLNIYLIQRIAGDVSQGQVFRGVLPFLGSDFVRIALLLAFPPISLFLVHAS
ncbi:TRAP transporter large permease subunit [Candidatus Symbiobacter mobilis]